MKLVDRKTQKAIEKSVRKAMRKHGQTIVAGLASALVSSIATLASTQAPGKHGKSNLADLAERAEESLSPAGRKKSGSRKQEKKRRNIRSTDRHDEARTVPM